MREITVEINGTETTIQVEDGDPLLEQFEAAAVDDSAKSRKASNKSRSAANKST